MTSQELIRTRDCIVFSSKVLKFEVMEVSLPQSTFLSQNLDVNVEEWRYDFDKMYHGVILPFNNEEHVCIIHPLDSADLNFCKLQCARLNYDLMNRLNSPIPATRMKEVDITLCQMLFDLVTYQSIDAIVGLNCF